MRLWGPSSLTPSHCSLYAHLQLKYSTDRMDSQAIFSERQACQTWNVKYCCHFSPCPIGITEKNLSLEGDWSVPCGYTVWMVTCSQASCSKMTSHMLTAGYNDICVKHLCLILKPLNSLIYMLPKLTVMVTRVMGWIWEWFMTAVYA